jgi:hypothetical protein
MYDRYGESARNWDEIIAIKSKDEKWRPMKKLSSLNSLKKGCNF